MRPAPLLDLASELLRAVLRFDSPADGLLSEFFRSHRQLGPRERQTLAETAYTVIRQRLVLRHLAQGGSGTLERRLAILAWAGDERTLTASLSAAEIGWLEQARAVDRQALPDAMRLNLPDWLAQALRSELGDESEFLALVRAVDQPAPLDLRVNLLKIKRDAAQRSLAEVGIQTDRTAWSPWGLRVVGKPSLLKTPAYLRGEVEIQDEGSQLIAALLGAHRGEMVVDFCAGAGGKTLAIGAAMRNTGRLYAFDTSGHRLAALKPRLERSGLSNVYPVQISHERDERIARLAGKVDRVLVDAPCSGLGTLRRNPDLKWRQTPETVAALRDLQSAILTAAARMLRPGGRLVYATCSLLSAENEAIAADFGAAHRDFAALPAEALLAAEQVPAAQPGTPPCVRDGHLRLWPHRHGSDGFFATAWQRMR
jgi:16S rRNA (cytosine967-C5)-methyltransferase